MNPSGRAYAATLLTQREAANFSVIAGVRIVSIDGGDLALRWSVWQESPAAIADHGVP